MTVHITNTLEPAVGEDKILSITQIYFKDEGGKESGDEVIGFGICYTNTKIWCQNNLPSDIRQ